MKIIKAIINGLFYIFMVPIIVTFLPISIATLVTHYFPNFSEELNDIKTEAEIVVLILNIIWIVFLVIMIKS